MDEIHRMFVYGLFDPRYPQHIRYVGQTEDVDWRMERHFYEAFRYPSPKNFWIRELHIDGVHFHHRILENVSGGTRYECRKAARDAELRLIHHWAYKGHEPILNQPHWEKAMAAQGVPRCVIQLYREFLDDYTSLRSVSETGKSRSESRLYAIQREFPQLFFREHRLFENFSLTDVSR